MRPMTIDTFLSNPRDAELGRYHVLAGLQAARKAFYQNRIYPTLSELSELYLALSHITKEADGLKKGLPKRIRGIDLVKNELLYDDAPDISSDDLKRVRELIQWGLPLIREALQEGETIYNFVDEHITVAQVGLLPNYVEEGYIFVPDMKQNLLHLIRYEVSIFTSADEQFRNLKTESIRTVPLDSIGATPWNLKQDLMRELRELPNPATYAFETDLDFPFDETMLPIAKRKLLKQLYS